MSSGTRSHTMRVSFDIDDFSVSDSVVVFFSLGKLVAIFCKNASASWAPPAPPSTELLLLASWRWRSMIWASPGDFSEPWKRSRMRSTLLLPRKMSSAAIYRQDLCTFWNSIMQKFNKPSAISPHRASWKEPSPPLAELFEDACPPEFRLINNCPTMVFGDWINENYKNRPRNLWIVTRSLWKFLSNSKARTNDSRLNWNPVRFWATRAS